MIMAVPLISYGSDDATTIKTEVIYEPGVMDLQTAAPATMLSFYDQFTNFNYVTGPILQTSLSAGYVAVHSLHNRWYIDICNTSSGFNKTNYIFSAKPNGLHTNDFNYWSWSACL